jgi:hypothetical protein
MYSNKQPVIYCTNSSPVFENLLIAKTIGTAVACEKNSYLSLINSSIVGKSGYGIYLEASESFLMNTILAQNTNKVVYFKESADSSYIYFAYSNIEGGQERVVTNQNGAVYWLAGNLTGNPSMKEVANSDYRLSDSSACLGTGIDSYAFDGIVYSAPGYDIDGNSRPNPAGSMPDMGAYESPLTVSIEASTIEIPETISLKQNFPNPFNNSTVIEFYLPKKEFVELRIYNLLGQEVRKLIDSELQGGLYKVEFKAEELSSGIYIYRVAIKNNSLSRKCLLIK